MARRASQRFGSGWALFRAALILCLQVLLCPQSSSARAAGSDPGASPVAATIAAASGVRVAGDGKQTRFILDLDRKIAFHASVLTDPDRVVIDLPQVSFGLPDGAGSAVRGLIKAFRYGLVLPGGSRIVLDLASASKIENAYVLDASKGQPHRLVVELAPADAESGPMPAPAEQRADALLTSTAPVQQAVAATDAGPASKALVAADKRPVIVIDPGHGGIDNGTQAGGELEKNLVLGFALTLRDRIERAGKYRVVMTRADDTFIPLGDRVKVARAHSAALFVSIHADALPRGEGDARGATIYTLSERASDAEAERLADLENKSDAIGGVNLTEEPTDVADILIDLAQRETRTFSNHFARLLMREMKNTARMHKHPLKSAGFKVLKAPDVPSVLLELGYVSNKGDLQQLVSQDWRNRAVGAVTQAVDTFLSRRVISAGNAN